MNISGTLEILALAYIKTQVLIHTNENEQFPKYKLQAKIPVDCMGWRMMHVLYSPDNAKQLGHFDLLIDPEDLSIVMTSEPSVCLTFMQAVQTLFGYQTNATDYLSFSSGTSENKPASTKPEKVLTAINSTAVMAVSDNNQQTFIEEPGVERKISSSSHAVNDQEMQHVSPGQYDT